MPARSTRTARASLLALAAALVALATTSCQRHEVITYDWTDRPELSMAYITRDGSDVNAVGPSQGNVWIGAPATNRATAAGSDTRMITWPSEAPDTVDQQSCATWTGSHGEWVQQGLALRVRIEGERLRTVVVAKNIVHGASWQMNVYTWDSERSPYLQVHGAVQLKTPFAHRDRPRPLPWRVCARVEGPVVTVKGWRAAEPEPSWDDPEHTGSVLLPEAWTFAGRAGWYAGHIPPGGVVGMGDVETSTWQTPIDR